MVGYYADQRPNLQSVSLVDILSSWSTTSRISQVHLGWPTATMSHKSCVLACTTWKGKKSEKMNNYCMNNYSKILFQGQVQLSRTSFGCAHTHINIYIYIKNIISISKWNHSHQWLYLNLIQLNSLPLQKHKTYLDIPTYVHALHYVTLKFTTIQYNTIQYSTYIHNFPNVSSVVFFITQTPQPRHIVHGESTTRWRQFFRFFGQGCSLFPWATVWREMFKRSLGHSLRKWRTSQILNDIFMTVHLDHQAPWGQFCEFMKHYETCVRIKRLLVSKWKQGKFINSDPVWLDRVGLVGLWSLKIENVALFPHLELLSTMSRFGHPWREDSPSIKGLPWENHD